MDDSLKVKDLTYNQLTKRIKKLKKKSKRKGLTEEEIILAHEIAYERSIKSLEARRLKREAK